jgi:cytochrome c-type biogenesis protein CcmH
MSGVRRVTGFFCATVALLLLASATWAIDPAPPFEDPVQQARYTTLIRELRCLKCQGENIADTPALFAVDMRRQVREMIAAGRTDREILDFMVDRYGEIILLKPRWSAKNAWLWLAPGVFLVIGGVVGWRIISRRRELLADDPDVPDDDVEPRNA